MPTSVAGIYKDGKIELLEMPSGVPEGPVKVIVLEGASKPAPRFLQRGKYRDSGRRMSTEDDFRIAEWHGEVLTRDTNIRQSGLVPVVWA